MVFVHSYARLLGDLQREYATARSRVTSAATGGALRGAGGERARDHCSLARAACSLLAHAARDECALYSHFFSNPSPALE